MRARLEIRRHTAEVTERDILAMLDRIAALDGDIRAFRRLDRERALADGHAAEARAGRGESRGPLDGVAFAVKENIDLAGWPTRAGLRDEPPPARADAPVVARLREAGAIPVGQTAMDEAAFGAATDNPHYGRTMNPRRAGFSPGGSSGGSAAAVAAGMVPFALGTDTLGSVRIPAAYCGVIGFKPSFGRVSCRGVVPLAPSLDHVGVLATDVALTRQAYLAMVDASADDPTLWPPTPLPAPSEPPILGIPDALDAVELEPAIRNAFDRAIDRIARAGFGLQQVHLPGWIPATARKASLLLLEAEAAALHAKWLADPNAPISEGLRKALQYGRDCGAGRVAQALVTASAVRRAAAFAFTEVSFLVMPTCPQPAFAFGQPAPVNQAELTALANLAGLPAISLPLTNPADSDLPAGLQLVGPAFGDERLLDLAEAVAGAL